MVEQDKAYLVNREAKKAVEGTVTEAAKNQENKSLSYLTAGDAKKGAGLFKVRPSILDYELSSLLCRPDVRNAIPPSNPRAIRSDPIYTGSLAARLVKSKDFRTQMQTNRRVSHGPKTLW